MRDPHLGGHPMLDPDNEIPPDACAVMPENTGYVQFIDLDALSNLAESRGSRVFIAALPGTFVYPARALAWLEGENDGASIEATRSAFSIDDERSFDQDPRFGLSVLAEIASRALSPALNDPGTAIDVIGRAVRVLIRWAKGPTGDPDEALKHPNVWVPAIHVDELFDDVFTPIARDGAALVEVHVRLQKALLALAQMGDQRFRDNAKRHSQLALKRAEATLALKEDMQTLRAIAGEIGA
jgi:uncharacterized membrane protein